VDLDEHDDMPAQQVGRNKFKELETTTGGPTADAQETIEEPTPFDNDHVDIEVDTARQRVNPDGDEKKKDYALERDIKEKKKLRTIREHHVWRQKIFRFLTYSINGLSDYMFTFESFIDSLTKCQSSGHDLNDFIIDSLNVRDMEAMNNLNEDIMNMKSVQISSLNEKSNISFNEEALAIAIKSGWLTEHLSDNLKNLPEFLKLILAKYSSNKILSTHILTFRRRAWLS
jgi:hypothetical protein